MPSSDNKPDDASSAPSAPAADPKTEDQAKPKTVVAKLRCLDHRGETVHTRWGSVSFDAEGLAELEVPEHELPMLRDVKPYSWLASDQPSYKPKAGKPGKAESKK